MGAFPSDVCGNLGGFPKADGGLWREGEVGAIQEFETEVNSLLYTENAVPKISVLSIRVLH